MAEGNAGLAEVVRGHLDVDAVADADADEVLAHLAGNVGQHFVAVWQRHAKHGARQYLGHRAGQFNWFFFSQAILNLFKLFLFWPIRLFDQSGRFNLWRRTMRRLPAKIKQLLFTKYGDNPFELKLQVKPTHAPLIAR